MNGLGFERYVANLLRAQGLTVYRSAASRGCADLVVSNDERQYLTVQCKKHGRVRYVRESGNAKPEAGDALSRPAGGQGLVSATANDVPACTCGKAAWPHERWCTAYIGLERTTASTRASAPSVGPPSSEGQDEEA